MAKTRVQAVQVLVLATTLAFESCHAFTLASRPASSCDRRRQELSAAIIIRDYREGDATGIYQLLSDAAVAAEANTRFDPEGPLEIDCGGDTAIQESYGEEDGCFLVAQDGNDNDGNLLVGCAGLVLGTTVTYLQSGASISSGTVTGALRRVCANTKDESVLESLLLEIETRAVASSSSSSSSSEIATELIVLGYPKNNDVDDAQLSHYNRPDPVLLERLHYAPLPDQIPGLNAIQYVKRLQKKTISETALVEPTPSRDTINNTNAKGETAVAITILLGLLLASLMTIANLMGLDLAASDNVNNRGFGSPLSTTELELLRQDEQLQRTHLDDGEWRDLTPEERQEEAALMKIIQGQDVRRLN